LFHFDKLYFIKEWTEKYGVSFKVNTVVNSFNWEEDMNREIEELEPIRWKVFKCLLIDGENYGAGRKDVRPFLINPEKFEHFVENHSNVKVMVP